MSDVTVIKEHIIKNFLFGEAARLNDDASLLDQGILDSTGVMELVSLIEEKFGFKVADTEIVPENFDSIANIRSYIEGKCRI